MKSSVPIVCGVSLLLLLLSGCSQQKYVPLIQGPYLGQLPPGDGKAVRS